MSSNINFVSVKCPKCSKEIIKDIFSTDNKVEKINCRSCSTSFSSINGSIKFLTYDSPEEEYYETKYDLEKVSKNDLKMSDLRKAWFSPLYKEISLKFLKFKSKSINHSPSNFKNKTILLLGNGVSVKELYFLSLGARIIYTDISHNAVQFVRAKYNFDKYKGNISFQAIDAENIPLGNDTVDYIIGYEFVHHLDEIKPFFNDIHRILKKNGYCFFYDSSHSPLWQKLKFSLLNPIVRFSHRKYGISPQDLKATLKGGFTKAEIDEVKEAYNFNHSIFFRNGLLSVFFRRFMIKIIGKNSRSMGFLTWISPKLNKIDKLLSRNLNSYYQNTSDLFWGFQK